MPLPFFSKPVVKDIKSVHSDLVKNFYYRRDLSGAALVAGLTPSHRNELYDKNKPISKVIDSNTLIAIKSFEASNARIELQRLAESAASLRDYLTGAEKILEKAQTNVLNARTCKIPGGRVETTLVEKVETTVAHETYIDKSTGEMEEQTRIVPDKFHQMGREGNFEKQIEHCKGIISKVRKELREQAAQRPSPAP